jgi:pimeloyl-ACP methyl ester carboxylesterase
MSPFFLPRIRAGAKDLKLAGMRVLALALALAGVLSASAGALDFGHCGFTPAGRSLCARVAVPLDRTGQVRGTLSLRVRALMPRHGAPTSVVLALAGGPGQAAVPLLDQIAGALGTALDARELVVFDQRGTGGSGRLACRALSGDGSTSSIVGRCASQLGPRRIAYTTAESVEDVEAVRAALGVDRLILMGTSYGTKVALEYAAAYPQHVERLVLDSAVPPGGVDPFLRTTVASIPRIVRELCAGDCRFARNPVGELTALVHRLERRLLPGTALDGGGHPQRVTLASSALLEMLVAGDLDPALRASLPGAVHAALHGDRAPLLRLAAGGSDGPSIGDESSALFLATTCEDGSVPWALGTPLQQRRAAVDASWAAIPAGALAPFSRATVRDAGIADLCRGWPESPIVQPQPPLPSTPTLILSGDDDLRTPRSDALALAHRLPHANLLEVPDAGHSVLGADPTDCAQRAVIAFLDGFIPGGCRPHPRALPTLPPPPRSLAAVHRLRGQPATVGRTIHAVVLTLADVAYQAIERNGAAGSFGGLRAGSASIGANAVMRVRGYSFVPGVTITGTLPLRSSSVTVTVGGRAAARGRLTFGSKLIAGTLAGHRVRVNPAKLGAGELASASALAALRLAAAPGPLPALGLAPGLGDGADRGGR